MYVCPSAQGQAGLGWPLRGSGDRGDEAAVLGKKGQEGSGRASAQLRSSLAWLADPWGRGEEAEESPLCRCRE